MMRRSALPDWELLQQGRRALRAIKWIVTAAVCLVGAMVLAQSLSYYQTFAAVHPWAGTAYLVAVTGLLLVVFGLPIVRYLRVPTAVRPPVEAPERDAHEATDRRSLVRRAYFTVAYLKSLKRNPELAPQREGIKRVLKDAVALRRKAEACRRDDLHSTMRELAQFERNRVKPLLAPLDAKVERYILTESLAIGLGTAVSMSGALDSFIVLWRSANMVCRVSRYYFGRPGLAGSLVILGDVLLAAAASHVVDGLTDRAGEATGKMIGGYAGVVAGPVMDGAFNALMAMHLGHLAKRRCRSFEPWTGRSMTRAARETAGQVMARSRELFSELWRQSRSVAGGAAARTTNGWRGQPA